MKIAYVTDGRLDGFMADVVHILQTVDAFTSLGHSVTLFARQGDLDPADLLERYDLAFDPDVALVPGFNWQKPWFRISKILNAFRIAREVRIAGGFDLVFGREPWSLMGLLGLGIPVIFEAHEMPGRLQMPILRRLFTHKRFARLQVISTSLRDDYLAAFPNLEQGKVRVVANGVSAAAIAAPAMPTALEGARQDVLQIGYVGALYHGKGMEVILPLATDLPACDFHIVGGRSADILTWQEAAPASVHFHGLQSRAAVFSFIDAFDVVLLPSQPSIQSFSGKTTDYGRWTSPMKLFEYMARGKAIIASDLPGIRDVVEDGLNALLVPPEDLDAWQRAVRQLADDPELRIALGRAARDTCEAEFTTLDRARARLADIEGLETAE